MRFVHQREMMKSTNLLVLLAAIWSAGVIAAESARIVAAGSLKGAFTELGAAFEGKEGVPVRFEFAPSGLLRDRLLKGESADVFASANMEHPQALQDQGMGSPVRRFARNSLCALASPKLTLNSDTLVDRLLDPSVKLGTATPKADPSGDYAFELFARVGNKMPGARERLVAKALTLTGGPTSPPPPKDRSQYGKIVEEGAADIFLTYCTNALQARKEVPVLQIIKVPDDISVGADYGMTVLGKSEAGARFTDFVLSPAGQAILGKHGFSTMAGN